MLHLAAEHVGDVIQLLYQGTMFNIGSVRVPMARNTGIHFPGLPLTALASSVLDEFSDEAKSFGLLGLFATVPVAFEYWMQFKDAERQRQAEADKARKEANRNMMDLVRFFYSARCHCSTFQLYIIDSNRLFCCCLIIAQVQFSLCMLRRLPPDHPDPAKRGKLQFMYTTLFEVKLEELVKGGEQTARLIGEAADKCTQVRANAPLHF
jgi:hypothetical protein